MHNRVEWSKMPFRKLNMLPNKKKKKKLVQKNETQTGFLGGARKNALLSFRHSRGKKKKKLHHGWLEVQLILDLLEQKTCK